MAVKKVSIDNLSNEVMKIISDYTKDVDMITDKVTTKAANMCVKEIRASSSSLFHGKTGKYAKGWRKKQTSFSNGHVAYTIYNTTPGLPHLLENGHQLRQGGTYQGKKHISVAEENATEYFLNTIKEEIGSA